MSLHKTDCNMGSAQSSSWSTIAIAVQSFLSCEISYSVQPFRDSCLWNKHIKRQGDAKSMKLFLLPVEHNQTILKTGYKYLKCKIRALQLVVLGTVFGNTVLAPQCQRK